MQSFETLKSDITSQCPVVLHSLLDVQNNSIQNVDRMNDESGGDIRIQNGISCSFINAKLNVQVDDVTRIDVDGNMVGNKINAQILDTKDLTCSGTVQTNNIRCAETISSKVVECDRVNTSGTTRIDHAGNVVCLSGQFSKFVDSEEFRTGGLRRIDRGGNINGTSLQTSGSTRIDANGIVTCSQVVLGDTMPISMSSDNGLIAITPLGTSAAIPSRMTSNFTEIRSLIYEASDSIGSDAAYDAFATGSSWVCNVADGYGFFGSYDGETKTIVNGRALGGEWVQLIIPEGRGIVSYKLSHDTSVVNQRPKCWTLVGSCDGETFFNVHSYCVEKVTDPAEEICMPLSCIAITHFRFIVTSIFPFSGNQLHGCITIDHIEIDVGFGKVQARQPKHMLDVSGTICANSLAFEGGKPFKIDSGHFEGPCGASVKFNLHFRAVPSVIITVFNKDSEDHEYAEVTAQSLTSFTVRQWSGTKSVPVCINWIAII